MLIEPYIEFSSISAIYRAVFAGLAVGAIFSMWAVILAVESNKLYGSRIRLALLLFIVGFFVGFGTTTIIVTRSEASKKEAIQALQPERLVFVGKVVDKVTGEWPNERLVLLFLKNKEIARTATKLDDISINGQGPTDGLFILRANNDYKLSLQELGNSNYPELETGVGIGKEATSVTSLFGTQRVQENKFTLLYFWMDEVEEGEIYHIPISSKNTEYVLVVLEGNATELPNAIQSNPLELRDDGSLIVTATDVSYEDAVGDANVADVTFVSDPEIIALSSTVIPINNCNGSATFTQVYTSSQTYIHEYLEEKGGSIGGEIPLTAWLSLVAKLEATYGFEQKEISSQSIEYTMAAEPGTNQIYTISWKEVWQPGVAEVILGDGPISIPFRAKTNLIYEVESEKRECN